MPTDAAFRLSLYLTLGLACACVGYAEHDLFPEVPVIAGVSIAALAVLYRLETRVVLLSLPNANRLGLVLGVGYSAWAVFRLLRVINAPATAELSIQLLLVAIFGPLLTLLMPAKLARREKHVGDYWGLHAAGLVAVALSGAVAEDAVSFLLIGLYAAAALWSLALFHLRRAAGAIAPIPNRAAPPPVAAVVTREQPRAGAGRALGLVAAAGALAGPLYFLTPRSPAEKLEFGKPRVEVGFAADQMVNLNQTGTLRENPAPAFEVYAEANGVPKTDLPENQRWRGRVLRGYANGAWQFGEDSSPATDVTPRIVFNWKPPKFGPGDWTLAYSVPWSMHADFLAEPVWWAAGQPPPAASLMPAGLVPWNWIGDGSFISPDLAARGQSHQYVQVVPANADQDLGPRFRIADARPLAGGGLLHNPVRRVKEYADALVERMRDAGQLPPNYRDVVTQLPRRELHDRIARAFSKHLATSPEFTYTLELRRERKDLDPVEDFLFHTRAGHCERFASALALMLRSQGIPAVLVLGFKGREPTAEPGRYVVRQEHAHAWVDAIIIESETAPPGLTGRPVSRWLSLDPTPAGSPAPRPPATGWGAETREWVSDVFREYIANYSAEQRQRLLAAVGGWLRAPEVLGAAAAVVVLFFGARHLRRRLRAPVPPEPELPPAFLARLFAVLAAHGFRPRVGETPREFAARVADVLGGSRAAGVAGVPLAWADAYYETRFGGRPLPPLRLDVLEAGLEELEAAFAAQPPTQREPNP